MHIYDRTYRLYSKLVKKRILGKVVAIISKITVTIGLLVALRLNLFSKFIFFYKVNNKLKLNIQRYNIFSTWLINNIYHTKNIEYKCYYLHIIFVEKFGTKELFEEYMQTISLLDNKLLQYKLGAYEIPWLWFLYPEIIYRDYFIKHRQLLELIANNIYDKSIEKPIKHIANRIAIMVMGLHSKRHASARLEVYLANEFAKQGYDVTIFVADTYKLCENENYILEPLFSRKNYSTIFLSDHNYMKHKNVNICYNEADTAEEMYNNYIKQIYDYSPEYIIDITWENAVFNPILKKDFKIISVPLGSNITAADVNGYISRDITESINLNNTYQSLTNIEMEEGNIYIPYDTTLYKRFKRKIYGIDENDFVVITVGNRLEYEINDELIREMCKVLDKHQNIKWLWIGPRFKVSEKLLNYIENKQIIMWGYERELLSLYHICDCFLNPARAGGGGSIAGFIQCNKPAIVTNTPSDILPFIGIENTVQYSEDKDLITELIKIYTDRQYGNNLAEKQRAKLMRYELTPEHYVKQIIKLYNKVKGKKND